MDSRPKLFPISVPVSHPRAPGVLKAERKPTLDIKKEVDDMSPEWGGISLIGERNNSKKSDESRKEILKTRKEVKREEMRGAIDVIHQLIAMNRLLRKIEVVEDEKEAILKEIRFTLNILEVGEKNKKKRPYECPKCKHHGRRAGAQHRSERSRGYQAVCPFRDCRCPPCVQQNAKNRYQNERYEERRAAEWRKTKELNHPRQQERAQL